MVVIGVVALASRRIPLGIAVPIAVVATALGFAALVLAASQHSLGLFVGFCVLTGIGYSLLFAGGLQIVGRYAPSHHRAGTLSAVYLIGYLVQGAAALWLGGEATAGGLAHAVDVGAPAIVGLTVVALVLVAGLVRSRRPVAA
jgi:MFS family permease